MRRRRLRKLIGDLRSLRRRVRDGQLQQRALIQRAIGRLQERHPQAWRWLKWALTETDTGLQFTWDWEREKFQKSVPAEGAYPLRAHWTERDPAKLWQIPDQLGRIALVEGWFELRDGRRMCLPRIKQPEPAQAVLLAQLNWSLPQQPPPRMYAKDLPPTGPELTAEAANCMSKLTGTDKTQNRSALRHTRQPIGGRAP